MNKYNKPQVHTVVPQSLKKHNRINRIFFFSSDYKVHINPAVSKSGRYGQKVIKGNSVYDRAWVQHTDEKEVFKVIQV